jgi:hypothetical protein
MDKLTTIALGMVILMSYVLYLIMKSKERNEH